MIRSFALIISFLYFSNGRAQISGKIVDSKTRQPIEGVEVFINNTTIATSSDANGMFEFQSALTGFLDLVLHKQGYSVFRSSMKIQGGRKYNLNLTLTLAQKKKGKPLTITENEIIKTNLTQVTESTAEVTILNQADLRVVRNHDQSILVTKAPLVLQNKVTGYLLKYFLAGLPLSEISRAPVLFENLPSSDVKQNVKWEKSRKEYFNGSLRHWLVAAVAGRMHEEGFSCQDADGNEVDSKTFVTSSSIAGYKKVNIQKSLLIRYQKNNSPAEVSRLMTSSSVDVSEIGVPINPKAIFTSGQMAMNGLADQLPIEYLPVAGNVEEVFSEAMKRFYEKIYIHTDKPYYYPGETIWFKAYLSYYHKPWRDSLSRTLYIELIGQGKRKLMEKMLRIDSGSAANDFILADSLKEGNYYLRAYTNLNRNFGDSSLCVKLIPILNLKSNLDTLISNDLKQGGNVVITPGKKKYHTRERISLRFEVKSRNPLVINSNLSVSVTDMNQVAPILEKQNILNSLQVDSICKISNWQFNQENGFGLRGRFLTNKGKLESVPITIIQTKPRNLFYVESNQDGTFLQSNLNFYDTVSFAFKVNSSKNHSYGKFELFSREIPCMCFKESAFTLKTKSTDSRQMIVSEYINPNKSRMLDEVVIKSRKIQAIDNKARSTYGLPDATTEKDFKPGPNLLYSISGTIAGLFVDPLNETIYISRSRHQSILNQYDPLLMIDDVPVSGKPGPILANLNPTSVESISFTKRLNVLYGSQGNAGVISVYLKKGPTMKNITPDFQLIKVYGYALARAFHFPDYDDAKTDKTVQDYRATIYWNPNVKINGAETKSISFFAADLRGRYRVVVEGVTEAGDPVRGEAYLDIDND